MSLFFSWLFIFVFAHPNPILEPIIKSNSGVVELTYSSYEGEGLKVGDADYQLTVTSNNFPSDIKGATVKIGNDEVPATRATVDTTTGAITIKTSAQYDEATATVTVTGTDDTEIATAASVTLPAVAALELTYDTHTGTLKVNDAQVTLSIASALTASFDKIKASITGATMKIGDNAVADARATVDPTTGAITIKTAAEVEAAAATVTFTGAAGVLATATVTLPAVTTPGGSGGEPTEVTKYDITLLDPNNVIASATVQYAIGDSKPTEVTPGANQKYSVPSGAAVLITFTLKQGAKITSVKDGAGNALEEYEEVENAYIIEEVKAAITISVTGSITPVVEEGAYKIWFDLDDGYSLSISYGETKGITTDGQASVKKGETVTVEVVKTPEDEEYELSVYSYDDHYDPVYIEVTAVEGKENTYTFKMPDSDVTIHAGEDECSDSYIKELEKDHKDFPDYWDLYKKTCACRKKASTQADKQKCMDDRHGYVCLEVPDFEPDQYERSVDCKEGESVIDGKTYDKTLYSISAQGTKLVVKNSKFNVDTDSSIQASPTTEKDKDGKEVVKSAGYLGVSSCNFTECKVYRRIISSSVETTIRYCIFTKCQSTYSSLIQLSGIYPCSVSNCEFTSCSSANNGPAAITSDLQNKLVISHCYFKKCHAPSAPATIRIRIYASKSNAESTVEIKNSAFEENTVDDTTASEGLDVAITGTKAEDVVAVAECYTTNEAAKSFQVGTVTELETVKHSDKPADEAKVTEDAGIALSWNGPSGDDDDDDGFPVWAIVLIVVVAVAIIAAVVVVVILVVMKKPKVEASGGEETKMTVTVDSSPEESS